MIRALISAWPSRDFGAVLTCSLLQLSGEGEEEIKNFIITNIKMKTLFLLFAFTGSYLYGQTQAMPGTDPLPFREIPDYPAEFTPETVVARLIEGMGFR